MYWLHITCFDNQRFWIVIDFLLSSRANICLEVSDADNCMSS